MENYYRGVKTKQQMADEYGVCRKTFNKLLIKGQITLERGLIIPIYSQKFPIIPSFYFDSGIIC